MSDSTLDHQPKSLCEYFSQWEDFEDTLFIDEFDAAFVGFGWQFSVGPVVVYDENKVLDILVANGDGESEDPYADALDHFGYNVQGQYVGERTPIFLTHEEDRGVQDFLKRQMGAEISGWSVDIVTEGVTEIS